MAKKDKKKSKEKGAGRPDMSGKPFEDGRARDPLMCMRFTDENNEVHEFKFTPEDALEIRNALDDFIAFVREGGYMIVED